MEKHNRDIRLRLWFLVALLLMAACKATIFQETENPAPISSLAGKVFSTLPAEISPDERYLFYIHGKIIETEGINAVSPEFGPYEFTEILDYFAEAGFNVIGEVSTAPPDPGLYADHIGEEIQYLLDQGVGSDQITVVGFSKGGGLTLQVSDLLMDPDLKYVLIGICGDWIDRDLKLTGNVLSLYEESDPYGSSCQSLADRSNNLSTIDILFVIPVINDMNFASV